MTERHLIRPRNAVLLAMSIGCLVQSFSPLAVSAGAIRSTIDDRPRTSDAWGDPTAKPPGDKPSSATVDGGDVTSDASKSKTTDKSDAAAAPMLDAPGPVPGAEGAPVSGASKKANSAVASDSESSEAAVNDIDIVSSQKSKVGDDAVVTVPTPTELDGNGSVRRFLTGTNQTVLQGKVSQVGANSPLLEGSLQAIPDKTEINFIAHSNFNSELTQKGSEVLVEVAHDVGGTRGVAVPGGWYAHGIVTAAEGQKRGGRDGYLTIKFDKLISPDRQTEIPFETEFTTKDSTLKSVAKVATIDAGYTAWGAAGGAILTYQITGLGVAIATHGISIGVGAAIGGTIGLYGGIKRKGDIRDIRPGDTFKLTTAEPITMPGFKTALLPSAKAVPHLKNVEVEIDTVKFTKAPSHYHNARLLTIKLILNNLSDKPYSFGNMILLSDFNTRSPQTLDVGIGNLHRFVEPGTMDAGEVSFIVDANKQHKYWLVLLDRSGERELSRFPIN